MTMVQDSGGVPLSVKGVVIGLNAKSMDVLWDVPFLSGTTLGGRYVHMEPGQCVINITAAVRSTVARRSSLTLA